jgi:hypothetical protein
MRAQGRTNYELNRGGFYGRGRPFSHRGFHPRLTAYNRQYCENCHRPGHNLYSCFQRGQNQTERSRRDYKKTSHDRSFSNSSSHSASPGSKGGRQSWSVNSISVLPQLQKEQYLGELEELRQQNRLLKQDKHSEFLCCSILIENTDTSSDGSIDNNSAEIMLDSNDENGNVQAPNTDAINLPTLESKAKNTYVTFQNGPPDPDIQWRAQK